MTGKDALPGLRADVDQKMADLDFALDCAVGGARAELASGSDRVDVIASLAKALRLGPSGQLATALAAAIIRLAEGAGV